MVSDIYLLLGIGTIHCPFFLILILWHLKKHKKKISPMKKSCTATTFKGGRILQKSNYFYQHATIIKWR